MFENKIYGKGIWQVHYSRLIISWLKSGGSIFDGKGFKDWLKSLKIDEESIDEIYEMFRNGKLEFEISAKTFLENRKSEKDIQE